MSYFMEHVPERIGVMINKDVKYYNLKAQKAYERNAQKLMNYQKSNLGKSP